MTAEPGIAGSQDFIPGAEDQFLVSRDFTNDCCTCDSRSRTYV
jgi:hypothetical protein